MKEDGIKAAITFESVMLKDNTEIKFEELVELMMEKLKNESTAIKEKKNIINLLDIYLSSEREVKVEEIIPVISEIEKEGKRNMKLKKNTWKEREEWRELSEAALLLQFPFELKNEENEENEKMGYSEMLKEKKEKERELEIEKKKVEEMEELEEERINIERIKDSEIHKRYFVPATPTKTDHSHSYNKLSFMQKLYYDKNIINIRRSCQQWEIHIIDYEMKQALISYFCLKINESISYREFIICFSILFLF